MRGFAIFFIFLCIIVIPAGVLADSDNDSYLTAERTDSDLFQGSLNGETDNDDWYIIEVPPLTELKITIRLISSTGEITVDAMLEDSKEEWGIGMVLDGDLSEQTDWFTNEENSIIDLYLWLNGQGDYEVELRYERDFLSGCCGLSVLLAFIPLAGAVVLFKLLRKREL